jgi:hypothetical protein
MLQMASLHPCLVLSVVQSISSNHSSAWAAGPNSNSDASTNNSSSSSSSSLYWANVDGMLSMWQQSFGCHVTLASTDTLLPSKLVQLASGRAAAVGAEGKDGEGGEQQQPTRLGQHSHSVASQQQQQVGAGQPPAAVFVNPLSSTADAAAASTTSAAANQQARAGAHQLVHLLQQQWQQQLQVMGCGAAASSRSWRLPPAFTCKAPQHHTALHLSGSADYLLDLAQQIYSYNADVSHAEFEQHARYSGAVHITSPDVAAAESSNSSSSSGSSSDSGVAGAQSVVQILGSIDLLLVDVERPSGTAAHRQGWSTLYNLLYQLHGFVGFAREPLPDGRTRLGWIRRPDKLARSACHTEQR